MSKLKALVSGGISLSITVNLVKWFDAHIIVVLSPLADVPILSTLSCHYVSLEFAEQQTAIFF